MKYSIDIKEGYGDIHFGMSVDQVVDTIGQAEDVETIDNAVDEMTTVLHYCDGMLNLFFEGDTPELTCIDTSVEESTLFGQPVFEMDEKEIVKLMVDNQYYEEDADEEAWGERRVSFGEGNVDFFFDDGELSSIVYGK